MLKPHITEKTYRLAGQKSPVFTFIISSDETIETVKAKVFAKYKKKALDVRFTKNAFKRVTRNKIKGKKANRIKALVSLKPGEMIADFEISDKKNNAKE